eukprot:NODE_61_length_25240_cov_0.547194.p3 type:complete len:597 gc:universal NODE_61_length_25240_cov_0.547194:8398-6608(-)
MVHIHFGNNSMFHKDVKVWGSFNKWKTGVAMIKMKTGYYVSVLAKQFPLTFKFQVDGNWCTDERYNIDYTEGYRNNILREDNKVDSGLDILREEIDPKTVQNVVIDYNAIQAKFLELSAKYKDLATYEVTDILAFQKKVDQTLGDKSFTNICKPFVKASSEKQTGGNKFLQFHLEKYFSSDLPFSTTNDLKFWDGFSDTDNLEVYMIPFFKTEESVIPIHIIHPSLFHKCVSEWQIQRTTIQYHIDSCLSLPVNRTIKFLRIDWNDLDNLFSIYDKALNNYQYVLVLDIANFFYSLYTHSLSWLCIGRQLSKSLKDIDKLWVNGLDKALQSVQQSETSGIPNAGEFFEDVAKIAEISIANEFETELRQDISMDECMCLYGNNLFEVFSDDEKTLLEIQQIFIGILCRNRLNLNYHKRVLCKIGEYPKLNLVIKSFNKFNQPDCVYNHEILNFITTSLTTKPYPYGMVFHWCIKAFNNDIDSLMTLLQYPYCIGNVLKVLMSKPLTIDVQRKIINRFTKKEYLWMHRATTQLLWILCFVKKFDFPIETEFLMFYNHVSSYSDYFVQYLLNTNEKDVLFPDWSLVTLSELDKIIGMPK